MAKVQMYRLVPSEAAMEKLTDAVAEEEPLHIFLNKKHYVTILSTPSKKKELALGHLISEGMINSIDDLGGIELVQRNRCEITLKSNVNVDEKLSLITPFARIIGTGCGTMETWPLSKLVDRLHAPKVPIDKKFDAMIVLRATQNLNILAENFRKTGGLHAAALYDVNGTPLAFAEDVGRHNAIDKVIGESFLKKKDIPANSFISTTGRLTADIVLKIARVRVPLVASLSAPLGSGVQVARLTGLTLIGFVRGPRMNVYTGLERLSLKTRNPD